MMECAAWVVTLEPYANWVDCSCRLCLLSARTGMLYVPMRRRTEIVTVAIPSVHQEQEWMTELTSSEPIAVLVGDLVRLGKPQRVSV